ncbi:hypothetical protein BOTBODRAFT_266928 [Botryobasidium botryosum FD-172 SS1]|uniref:RNA-binding protein VTS1 n=1 Tax=Botryobasidium botryosum (strain FD-172 SS1) TaxID=930990 RepID=A0A067MW07_BOTB1|nr:hypothetical protein BOTBODRAFT_266928 [Botryobasidium botryosum FD-172 SS1]
MSTLRPPSTSPSPSPAPANNAGGHVPPKINTRASMQPSARNQAGGNHAPLSPRPGGFYGGGRPTSELLGNGVSGMFQTPEAEAIDQWFENLQNYETTLEEMAAASLDVNFKEELSAIEQWFRVLSEAERTAALYSLLQHSTQMQIRFFITVLQQMARSDPMTALLSPAVGASMQNQMEAKLASMGLKSPGLPPSSPSARNFSGSASAHRQSFAGDPSSFLSPDSAANLSGNDAAATLAQQRAKLKANAANRISLPGTLGNLVDSSRWPPSQLGQVAERSSSPSNNESSLSPPTNTSGSSSRPKSTDFSGVANSFRAGGAAANDGPEDQLSPMVSGNWASMVNTPLVPMFSETSTGPAGGPANLDAAAAKLSSWSMSNNNSGRVVLDDARKFRRPSKATSSTSGQQQQQSPPGAGSPGKNGGAYGEDNELSMPVPNTHSAPQGNSQLRHNNNGGTMRMPTASNSNNNFLGNQPWGAPGGARSPALSNVSSGRFGGSDDAMSGLGISGFSPNMGGGLNPLGMNVGGMGMPGFNMFNGMNGMNGMPNMNGMDGMANFNLHQAQLLAAQLAAANGFNPGMNFPGGLGGMGGLGVGGMQPQQGSRSTRSGPGGSRSPGKASSSVSGRDGGGGGSKDKDDDVDPAVLNDVPAWLRSLRLHKYTPNFEGMVWQDMVVMDEAALEAKGVAALGARRKMLKTFEAVRNKMGIEHPPGFVPSA